MAQKKKARIKARRLDLADRIIASALTASTLLSPLSAAASELIVHKKYRDVANVAENNGKYTVTTGKTNSKSAFNRFEKFSLDPGHVANMILPNGTNKLYNFVDSKIEVHGLVNALKAETTRLGGHLIFISPTGMIIGKSGAINAGKFSAIIADDDTYKAITDQDKPWSHVKFKDMEKGYVALNHEGSIVVKGRVTAPDGIVLKAAKISTAAGSKLDTKTLDFSSLVNTGDLSNSAFTPDSDLKLSRTESGDVVLVADTYGGKEASVTHAGTIEAQGDAKISVRSAGLNYYLKPGATPKYMEGDVDFNATATAKVTVKSSGRISASHDIAVEVNAMNYRDSTNATEYYTNWVTELFNDIGPLNFDGSFTSLKSTADVTVESGARLEAAQDLNLTSFSNVGAKVGTDLGWMDLINWKKGESIPAVAIVISDQKGSAAVNVDGELKAGRDLTLDTNAVIRAGLTAKAAKNNFDAEAPFMSAVLIADLDNHAAAGVGKNAKISAGRDIKITPSTQNTISTNATASAPARSPGGTALNATFVTTGASAAVSSDLTAGGSVTISGFDYTDSWTAKAVTKASISPELNAPALVKQLMTPTYKAFYKKLADKIGIPENMRYGNGTKEADYSTEWGFAALYTGKDIFHGSPATQTAAATIAPDVKITSHGFIDITSAAQVIDHQWITTSSVGGHEKTAGDTVDTYAFALNYDNAEMDSTASVGKNAQLNAGGKIDISSLANVEWHRMENTISDLKSDWGKFLLDVSAEKARELWKAAYDKLSSDEYHDTDLSNSEGFKNYAKAMGGFIKGAYVFFNEEWGAFKDLLTVATDPLSFLDFSSYANVYAGASAKTLNEEQKQKSGGGTFAYPSWHLNNLVDIASGAKLTSAEQVKVTGSTQSDMSFIGGWSDSLQSLLTTETKGSAVGGTILVGTFETQDEVRIHKGALLQSGKDVNVATVDNSMFLVANIASAKSGGYGWQGQLNVLDGTVAGSARVDDEATLSGTSIDIISNAENYATNVAAAIQRAADSAVGVSIAIDSLTYQNVARVADFDSAFSDDTSPLTGASIAADALTVEAAGHHLVNTIAASGVVSRQERQGELQIGEGLQNLLDYPLNIAKKIGTKIGNKIQPAAQPAPNPAADPAADPLEVSINDSLNEGAGQLNDTFSSNGSDSSDDPFHFQEGYDDNNNALDNANNPVPAQQNQQNNNLGLAASVAWNFADYEAHAGIEGKNGQPVTIKSFTPKANRSVTISALANKWQAAFSGGAALAFSRPDAGVDTDTTGIGGTLSVNSGKSIVSADLKNATIAALDASKGARSDDVSVTAGSTGRSIVGALGFAFTNGNDTAGMTLAANVSANTLNNSAHSTVANVTTSTSGAGRPVSTDLEVLSYARDTQVTGAIDLEVGKTSKGIGAGVQVAVIKNDLGSSIENSTMNNLGLVTVDSYLGVTQVVAGVAVAAGTGETQGGWNFGGSLVVDTLINKAAAKVTSSDLTASGTVRIAAGDGADMESLLNQNSTSPSTSTSTSFDQAGASDDKKIKTLVSADSYYKGAELRSGENITKYTSADVESTDVTVDSELYGHKGMIVVTAALSGSGNKNGKAVGAAGVVNNLRNTFDVQVDNSSVKASLLTANSENNAALVSVAAGTSVAASGEGGWAAYGSVIWDSIVNKANTTFKNSNITITGNSASSLTAQNKALSVGVAGAVGVSFGGFAGGVSLGYQHITNDAVLSVTGGAKNKTISGAGGALNAQADSSANSWLAGLAASVSTAGTAVGGDAALHRLTGETSSTFDDLTIKGFKDLSVEAHEASSAKTLAGGVSFSTAQGSIGGTVAVAQIGTLRSETQKHTLYSGLKNSSVTMADKAGTLSVTTDDDATIFTASVGGGYGNNYAAAGALAVNVLHRRSLAEMAGTAVTGNKTTVSVTGSKDTALTNIGLEIAASSTGAGGGSIVVNRIGDENLVSVSGTSANTLNVGSLYSLAASGTRILNVGLGISGAGTGAGQGMVLVNSMSPSTGVTVEGVTVRAQESLAAIAQSDAEIRNYVGQGAGAGTFAGAGLVQVNYINDETSTLVKNASLTVLGAGKVTVSNDIDDGDIDNTKISSYQPDTTKDTQNADAFAKTMPSGSTVYDNAFRGVFDSKPLRKQRAANEYKGVVIDASSTHALTNAALVGAGSGTGAGAGSVNVDVLAGSTSARTLDSALSSSSDVSVHAGDFSNVSGVFVDGAVSGVGAGAGIVNVRSAKRDVDASVKSSSLSKKYTLNVTGTAAAGAVSKQSLTTFAVAGAGSGTGAGVALVEVDVQRGSTTAVIDGVQGTVGALQTAADHFTRVGQIDVGGAGSMGAGALMVSVGVDKSRTAAQVRNASLGVAGGSVDINARNRVKGYNITVTGAGGLGAGTIGVGVNYGSAAVDASLLNSSLGTGARRAGNLSITAHNEADLLTVAATASGGVGAGSIFVNVDDLYSDVGVSVSNSRVYARSIAISADEDYKLRAHAWGASGGVGAGLVYVQAINVGEDEPFSDPDYTGQLNSVSADKASALDKVQKFVSGESGKVSTNVLSAKERQLVSQARNDDTDIRQSQSSTLHVSVNAATVLDASENITVAGVESTDIISYQGGFTGGVGAGAVNLSFMSVRKQTGVTIDQSKLNAGGSIDISAELTGDNDQHVIQGIGGLGALFAAYGRLTADSSAAITAKSSDLTGVKGVSLSALDTAVNESYGAGGTLAGVPIGAIVVRTNVDDSVKVSVDGGSLTSSSGEVALNTKRAGTSKAQIVFGYVGGASGLGTDARVSETTQVAVTAGSADKTVVTAKKFTIHSELNPYLHANTHQHGGSVITGVGVPLAEAELKGGSTVTLGASNVYSVPAIAVESFVGGADKPLRMFAEVHSYGGTLAGLQYDYARAVVKNDTAAKIDLKGGSFDQAAAFSLHAWNNSGISADIESLRAGVLTLGSMNNGAKVFNFGKANVGVSGASKGKLTSLDVTAESTSNTRAKANGDGGGATYFDNAAPQSDGAGKAAWALTSIDNVAKVDIGGSWSTSGVMKLTSRQSARTDDWADAVIGGGITASSSHHDLLLDGQASVSVAKNSSLNAGGKMQLDASNAINDNPENHYTASGNTYGAVAGNGTNNRPIIHQTAAISVGEKAKLTAGGDLSMMAHSDTKLNEYSRVVSGGAGVGSDANINFDGTFTNTITVESGAKAAANGLNSDVSVGAWNTANILLTALGNLQLGLIGGATSHLNVKLTRNNTVTVKGSIDALRDVNLSAGRGFDLLEGDLNIKSISQAYAHAIGGAGAYLDRTITQNNAVTVAKGAAVNSTRNAALSAEAANATVIDSIERYAWIGPSKKTSSIASTALGDSVASMTTNAAVTVDGAVNAGHDSKVEMEISNGFAMLQQLASGDYAMMDWTADGKMYLKKDGQGNYTQGTASDHHYVMENAGSQTPVITVKSGTVSYRLGLNKEYDTYLYDRLAALDVLIEGAAGDRGSSAYLAYVAERQQLISTLQQYGLPETRPAANMRAVPLMVPWLEIDPISVSGGNITVKGSTIKGSGTLNANGAPVISITNASNLALKLNGLSILAPGGEVIVNTVSVKDAADMRSRVKAAAGFSGTVIADADDGAGANITVKNTWSNAYVDFKMTDRNDTRSSVRYAVVSDIENVGSIVNYPGTVTLATAVGSIRSVSADIVGGKGISIEAPRGSISLTSEGILNIDSAPETVWGAWLKRLAEKKDLNDAWQGLNAYGNPVLDGPFATDPGAFQSLWMNGDFSKTGHVVSGGNIFITAGVINVNGTIQSGFGTYSLNIGSELAAKVSEYDAAWKKAGSAAIADTVSQLSAYKLTESGITYDDVRGEYISNPATWYNPSTKRIVVDDIIGSGGTIYLTGKVINTNVWDSLEERRIPKKDVDGYASLAEHRGRIIAYTGASEVNIDSALDTTLRLGKIDAKSSLSRIVINDTGKAVSGSGFKTTEYSYENSRLNVKVDGTVTSYDDEIVDYSPAAGLRYITNAVQKRTTTERRTQTQEFDWWSDSWKNGRSTSTTDQRSDDAQTVLLPGGTVMTIVDFINKLFNEKWDKLSDDDKQYFKQLRDHPETGDIYYTLRFEDLISTTATVKPASWPSDGDWNYNVSYNNWTHYAGKITRTAIISYGKQITITNAIKADNPIAVSIRESRKPGFITINAPKADVMLTDALKSNAAAGEVSVTAKNIIGNENALIYSNTVKLKAAETIGDQQRGEAIRITPIDDVADVKAEAGKSGKDGVKGIVNLAVLGGAASVNLTSAGGSVTLKAEDTITGKAEGADIVLGSDAGSIGSADLAFAIVGEGDSRLTAYANDTINIAKDKGDLKINSVETPGDVTLETKAGSIVDAYPVERDGALTDDEMIEIWKSAGIISSDANGSSVTAAMRREGLANMEALIRSDYAAYQCTTQTLKIVNEQLAGTDVSEEQKATLRAQKEFLEKQIASLSRFENVTSIDAYIAEQKVAKGTQLYELSQVDPEKTGGFTKDYLLYAVQDAILNPGPGTVKSDVVPFILGRTVTLRSSANIGSEDPEKKIKGGADLITNGMAGLKALSAANPADVTWNDDTGEFIINETHEIGIETDEATAKAKGMILIASPNQDLVINSVESTGGGKVHLMAGGDVQVSDRSTVDAAVKGGDMFIAAAGTKTDIGSADRPLTVQQTAGSTLRASAGRSVYLKAVSGDLSLGSISAREELHVETAEKGKGIFMSKGQGRLSAAEVLLMTNGGDIGAADSSIRVQNAESNDFSHSVTVIGADNIRLSGENGLLDDGWLNLHGTAVSNADIRSEGGIAVSGDMTVSKLGQFAASDDIIFFNNLNGGTVTLAAGRDATLVRATLKTLSADAGRDISIVRLKASSASLTSGAKTTASALIDSDTLTVVTGTDASFVDVKSKTLQIDAGGVLTTRTVRGYTSRLTAKGGLKANGDYDSDTLTIESGASAALAGLSAQRLTVTTSGDLSTAGVNADVVKMTSGGDVTVKGKIYGGQTNLEASGDVVVSGDTNANTLTVRSGADAQLAGVKAKTTTIIASRDITVADVKAGSGLVRTSSGGSTNVKAAGDLTLQAKSGGDLNVSAAKKLTMRGDASSGGDMYLTAHEISARNLTAEKNLTALSETTFTANDLKAGEDLRVHTYGDMTFNDATAGGSAWILGLGSSAAQLKFHEVRTGGRDTAILLERGYLDYWQVTAGLDVAVGVRTDDDPNDAKAIGRVETLAQDSAYYIFFPRDGSLMPKDPFNFHVPDLLHPGVAGKYDIDPNWGGGGDNGDDPDSEYLASFGREARRMWPRPQLPDLKLLAGSDDIEVNLDDYGYWLPKEDEQVERDNKLLSVSEQ